MISRNILRKNSIVPPFCQKFREINVFTKKKLHSIVMLSNSSFFVKLKSMLVFLHHYSILCSRNFWVYADSKPSFSNFSSNKIFRFWLQQPKAVSSNKLSGKIKTLAKKNQLTISCLVFFLFETWEFASLHSSWLLYVL